MARRRPRAPHLLAWTARSIAVLSGLATLLVAILIIHPWLSGTNDPDSMSTVLYWQRITSGQRLEVTVLTTPKPLLTVIFGVSWTLFHDWRLLVWETIAVHALGVAAGTRLAQRVGGIAAAVFVAATLIASSAELAEVSQANSLPWALLGWLVAALALTARPRRFWIAGVALLLAGMVRVETWILLAVATFAIAVLAVPSVRRWVPSRWPTSRSALPLLVGWLAVPAQLLHDFLLTGNPLYWLSVPTAYTKQVVPGLQAVSPLRFAHEVVIRYADTRIVVLLAAIGLGYLAYRRRWTMLLALTGLIAGVVVLLLSLAVRGIYISDRYYEEPDLGLLLAAGVGVGGLVWIVRRLVRRRFRLRSTAGLIWGGISAALVAALIVGYPGPAMQQLSERITRLQDASRDYESIAPKLRAYAAAATGPPPPATPAAGGFTEVATRTALLVVPRPFQRRIAVELDLSLTWLADSKVAFLQSPPAQALKPGQYVYLDVRLDDPQRIFAVLEVSRPTSLGGRLLVPVFVKQGKVWLLHVE